MRMLRVSSVLLFLSLMVGCKERQAAGVAPSGATGAVATTTGDILIGEVGSLTGSEATFGTSTRDGVELAIRQANAAGGINGRQLKIKLYDNQGKPEESASAITKLITQDKVVAVIGEVASSRSIAMGPIAQTYKIPMISPSSTNPKVTEIGDYIFRVCFIDPFQGTVMAKFASTQLKAKTAAILRDTKSDYSLGLAQYFTEAFTKAGGVIVKDEAYSSGDVHFKSQLTAIKSAKPDVIFVPGYYTEVGLVARQAKELGVNAPMLGGDGWDSPKLTEIGGKFIDGSYFSNHYSEELDTPEVKRFVSEFKAAFGYPPDGLAAMGFDAASVLIDSLKRAKDTNASSLRDAIAATQNFAAVTGKISIDAKRNPTKPAVVLKIEGGKYKYVTTIDP
jgi:branched-chain amino acid transport system substrate-binding protein